MIVFDIQQIPEGLDVTTWAEFIKEKILLFDSKLTGIVPFTVDDDKVSLINISSMSDEDWNLVIETKSKIDKVREEQDTKALDAMKQNQQRLVEYLQKLNKENS